MILEIGKMYNTMHGVCKYVGAYERRQPIREDKSDTQVHRFLFAEKEIWEIPDDRIDKLIIIDTEALQLTRMQAVDDYLLKGIVQDV